MDLQRLSYFVAVAEELHYGRAAARVHITQPALTRQIQALEVEVGVLLLRRTRQGVQLTVPGRLFLERAKRLLDDADDAKALARRADRGEVGEVVVGFVESFSFGLLPEAVRRFHDEHGGVHVTLRQMWSAELPAALREGEIDIGLFRVSRERDDLHVTYVEPERILTAIPASHPFARRETIKIEDLESEPLIAMPASEDYGVFRELWRLFESKGVTPNIVQEASGLIALGLVAANVGIAIVPATFVGIIIPHPNIVLRPIADELHLPNMVVATRLNESAPVVLLLQQILEEVAHCMKEAEASGAGASTPL